MKYHTRIIATFFFTLVVGVSISQAAVRILPDYYPEGVPTINREVPTDTNRIDLATARNLLTQRVLFVVLSIAGVLGVYFIINSGFWMVISAGKEETITTQKKSLTWIAVGMIALILSYSIIRFIVEIALSPNQPAAQTEETTSTNQPKEGDPNFVGPPAPSNEKDPNFVGPPVPTQ